MTKFTLTEPVTLTLPAGTVLEGVLTEDPPAQSLPPVDWMIVVGQSNHIDRMPIDPGYTGPTDYPSSVLVWDYQTESLSPATPPLRPGPAFENRTPNQNDRGMTLSFAHAWAAKNAGRQLVIVPMARGGTGFLNGAWIPSGPMYLEMVRRANSMAQLAPNSRCLGFFWQQGLGDKDMQPADYEAAMLTLIHGSRADISTVNPDTPWFLGRTFDTTYAEIADNEARKEAICADPANHAVWIDTTGIEVGSDGKHVTFQGVLELGRRCEAACAQVFA